MIFVFAKTPDDALAGLVKELDKAVAANAEKKLAAVVNFTGELTDEYKDKVAKFAEKNKIEQVALTMTGDAEKFKVNDAAEVTVMHYKGKEVKFNFATDKNGLNQQAIKAVVDGIQKVLE